jgi:hypothetical protein
MTLNVSQDESIWGCVLIDFYLLDCVGYFLGGGRSISQLECHVCKDSSGSKVVELFMLNSQSKSQFSKGSMSTSYPAMIAVSFGLTSRYEYET